MSNCNWNNSVELELRVWLLFELLLALAGDQQFNLRVEQSSIMRALFALPAINCYCAVDFMEETKHRHLADGIVHCAGSATYQIFLGYRTRSLTLNPNPITDPNPNPKINKKQNNTGMKLNIELYLKVDF